MFKIYIFSQSLLAGGHKKVVHKAKLEFKLDPTLP